MNAYLKERGYTDGLTPIDIRKEVKGVVSFLRATKIDYEKKPLYMSRKRLQENTKAFFAGYFSLHDVCILPISRALGFSGAIKANQDYKKAMEVYCMESSPFAIDLRMNYKDFHSYTEVESIYDEKNHHLTTPYFKSIVLAAPLANTSPCTYAHEIGHTQLDSRYGSITNYHNNEVISIFLEKLAAFSMSMETFHDMERRRLWLLKQILKKDYPVEGKENEIVAYTISTLKAEQLFDIYIESGESERAIMLQMIQMVFDNQMIVEELLDHYSITFENSLDPVYMQRNLTI